MRVLTALEVFVVTRDDVAQQAGTRSRTLLLSGGALSILGAVVSLARATAWGRGPGSRTPRVALLVVASVVVAALTGVGGPATASAREAASPGNAASSANAGAAGAGGAVAAWASSSSDAAHSAAKAIDGDLATGWQAEGSSGWLEIDLGALKSVTSVEQTFPGQAVWKFTVLGSVDGRNWATLVDRSAGGSGRTFSNDVNGVWRYLRLDVSGSSTGAAAASQEFSAQASQDGADLALGKPVTASSGAGDYLPGKAVDGDTSTYWGATSPSLPQWLQVDLGAPSVVTRVVQNFKDDGTYKFTIDGSLDGSTWTTLLDASSGAQGEQFSQHVSGMFRYVRLTITGTSSGYWAGSTEFGVYGFDNRARGAAATASSAAAGHGAAAAVDADSSTYWQAEAGAANPVLTVDLGGLVLVNRVEQTFAAAAPWRFTLLGSADGVNWTELMVNAPPAQGTTFAADVSGAYRYLRLMVHDAADGQPAASSRELAAYGTPITRNLAAGVSATTSSLAEGHEPSQAVDGDTSTYWSAGPEGTTGNPQWLTVDLGAGSLISRIQQTFAASGTWAFTIEGSTDKTSWHTLVDDSQGVTGQSFSAAVDGTYRYIRLTVQNGPAPASSRELTVSGIGSPVTDKWWEDTSGVRKYYINYDHDTLAGIQSQLDTLKSEGYGAIELTSLPQGWPEPFAGLAALDEFKVDPNAGTMADFKNLIAAAHARGIRVMFFGNLGYASDHAPFFIQAAQDYHNNVNSDVRSWFVFNPADNATACSAVGSNWHWSDVADVCYYAVWGSGAPVFNYASASWRAEATKYLKFWMDTGIDAMTLDAAEVYYESSDPAQPASITTPTANTTITDILETYDTYARAEGDWQTWPITDRHYDAGMANSLYLPNTPVYHSSVPAGLEDYAKNYRDPIVNVHGVMTTQPSWDTNQGVTPAQRLLDIAACTTSGWLVYLDQNFSDLSYLPQTDIIPKWPQADQETLWDLMRAQNSYQALAPVGLRYALPTNDDSKYYAYLRTSKQGGVKALTVLNYQDTPQTIAVNLAGSGISTDQTPINLVTGGAATPITSSSYRITLPAYGFAVLGVAAGTAGPAPAWEPALGPVSPNPVKASPGDSVPVSTTVTNPGTLTATNVSAQLQAPAGWTVTQTSAPTSIAGGATAALSWKVDIPASAAPGFYQLTLAVGYDSGGAHWSATPVTVPVYMGQISVSTVLGQTNQDNGLSQVDFADGQTTAGTFDGLSARETVAGTGDPWERSMYFVIDPSIAQGGVFDKATITVQYYDTGSGSWELDYDSTSSPYATYPQTVTLTGSNTWKTATFTVTDANFVGGENAGTDFRIKAAPDVPVIVHNVTVVSTQ